MRLNTRYLLCFLFVLASSLLFSSEPIDSVRTDSLNNLSTKFRNTDTQKALELAKRALVISKLKKDSNAIAVSSYNIGSAYLYLSEYDSSQFYLKIASSLFKSRENHIASIRCKATIAYLLRQQSKYDLALQIDKELIPQSQKYTPESLPSILVDIGIIYYYLDNYDSSEYYYRKALEANLDFDNPSLNDNALSNIAMIKNKRGNYKGALEVYFESLTSYKQRKDKRGLASTFSHIGTSYGYIEDIKNSLHYYQKALELWKKLSDKSRIITTLLNIADCHRKLGDPEKALKLNLKTLAQAKEIKGNNRISSLHINIGYCYLDLGQSKDALESFEMAMQIAQETNDTRDIVRSKNNIGEFYQKTKSYKKAIEVLESNVEMSEDIGDIKALRTLYYNLNEAYRAVSNFKEAYYYRLKYAEINDSLFNQQNRNKISELEIKYRTSEKENELLEEKSKVNSLEQEKKLESLKLTYVSIFAFLIVIISILVILNVRFRNRIKTQRITEEKLMIENKLKSEKLNSSQLESELQIKELELLSYAEQLLSKDQTLDSYKSKIEQFQSSKEKPELTSVVNQMKGRGTTSSLSWEEFRLKFDEVHLNFVSTLCDLHHDLTNKEIEISILLKINLSNKDIANILGVSYDAVKKSMQRLYKKLGLENSDELRLYLVKI